ncbi:hypothetical protein [Planctomycetes bacterium TBK1r]|uniref:Uncharacterized protein n=1 Tax=Stieleria magnilauensis TaxID=2527963 RepID=A0ABX5Y076_9BACT|nr:hypothetical protein TBK1r_44780 [Planctomycetes bacterium TBK1r]
MPVERNAQELRFFRIDGPADWLQRVMSHGDEYRFATGPKHRFDVTILVDRVQFTLGLAGPCAGSSGDAMSGNLGQVVRAMRIRQTNYRPLQPETWLSPNDLGAAGRFRL